MAKFNPQTSKLKIELNQDTNPAPQTRPYACLEEIIMKRSNVYC